jgi:hypothetical protein
MEGIARRFTEGGSARQTPCKEEDSESPTTRSEAEPSEVEKVVSESA